MATKQEEKTEQKFLAQKAKEPVTAPATKKSGPQDPTVSETGIPASRTDTKEETRLFGVGDEKVWLTESEAKAKGFYWRDEKKLGKA